MLAPIHRERLVLFVRVIYFLCPLCLFFYLPEYYDCFFISLVAFMGLFFVFSMTPSSALLICLEEFFSCLSL